MLTAPSLKHIFVGLILSGSAFAQTPPTDGALPPPAPVAGPAGMPSPATMRAPSIVTQSSRIRAFNPAPDGQIRSLYLSNGDVVNLSPGLSQQLSLLVRRVPGSESQERDPTSMGKHF
jgi:hypothetical protein